MEDTERLDALDASVKQANAMIALLTKSVFPKGVVADDTGAVDITPAPADINVGEEQEFTINGLGPTDMFTPYTGMASICAVDKTGPNTFKLRGVNGGLLSATAIITVQTWPTIGPQAGQPVAIHFTITVHHVAG